MRLFPQFLKRQFAKDGVRIIVNDGPYRQSVCLIIDGLDSRKKFHRAILAIFRG